VKSGRTLAVPSILRARVYKSAKKLGHGVGYKYAHEAKRFVAQDYLARTNLLRADGARRGKEIKERVEKWRAELPKKESHRCTQINTIEKRTASKNPRSTGENFPGGAGGGIHRPVRPVEDADAQRPHDLVFAPLPDELDIWRCWNLMRWNRCACLFYAEEKNLAARRKLKNWRPDIALGKNSACANRGGL